MYTQRIGEDSRVVMQPPELSTSQQPIILLVQKQAFHSSQINQSLLSGFSKQSKEIEACVQRKSFSSWSKESGVVNKDRYKRVNIVLFQLYELLRSSKIQTDRNRTVVTRGCRERGMRSYCLVDTEFQQRGLPSMGSQRI